MQKIILGENKGQDYLWMYFPIPTPRCRKVTEITVFDKILLMPEYNEFPIIKKMSHF